MKYRVTNFFWDCKRFVKYRISRYDSGIAGGVLVEHHPIYPLVPGLFRALNRYQSFDHSQVSELRSRSQNT